MQPSRNNSNKKVKLLDAKVFIASLALAVTVGLWNVFSNNALQSEGISPASPVVAQPQSSTNTGEGFPPLPTLVPLADGPINETSAGTTIDQPAAGQPVQLRSVAAPTLTIVQKGKPVFDQAGVVVVAGSNGSKSGQNSGHANTRSSRR